MNVLIVQGIHIMYFLPTLIYSDVVNLLLILSTSNQQVWLSNPSTHPADLFILPHGILFTNIQLDRILDMLYWQYNAMQIFLKPFWASSIIN